MCLPAKVQNRFMINMKSTGGSHRQITLKYVSFHVYLRLLIKFDKITKRSKAGVISIQLMQQETTGTYTFKYFYFNLRKRHNSVNIKGIGVEL